MVSCVVLSCKNTSGKISKNKDGITFHRFPKDKVRKKQWEIAVNRDKEWSASPSSVVCSEHFAPHDFYLTESGLRRPSLKAIPSINISACQDLEPTICALQPVDIKPTDSEEVVRLKYKVQRLEAIAEMRKKRLQLMRQAKQRLRNRLEQIKYFIKHSIKNEEYNDSSKSNLCTCNSYN